MFDINGWEFVILVVAVRAKSVGQEVELRVRRGKVERTVKMTLQAAN